MREIFEKNLTLPSISQRVKVDRIISITIRNYFPMVSISPNKNKGGGGGRVPFIGRALYEKFGNNGDVAYKEQMRPKYFCMLNPNEQTQQNRQRHGT